jgi:hypothetical protein
MQHISRVNLPTTLRDKKQSFLALPRAFFDPVKGREFIFLRMSSNQNLFLYV